MSVAIVQDPLPAHPASQDRTATIQVTHTTQIPWGWKHIKDGSRLLTTSMATNGNALGEP